MEKTYELGLLRGYLEAEVSFGIYLNLLEGKTRYLVLKPYILIQSKDKEVMEWLQHEFSFDTKITNKRDKTNVLNAMRVQSFKDIDKVLIKMEGHRFISSHRQEIYERFVKAHKHIKSIGHIWKMWDPKIADFINECLPLQIHKRRVYDNAEWIRRIQEHFTGDDVGA